MRYLSLDFFRGFTIALMIVVNTPGTWAHVFAPLRHAEWHGCTPTDLVFPFFLFIVGVSIWFSFSKFNRQLTPALTGRILRRTALIFLIGLALNAFPYYNKDWSALRIMGVLQRIALAYGLAAFLCVLLKKKQLAIAAGLILFAYWAAMWLGGTGHPYALATNFARQIDLAIFTEAHLYRGFGMPFDPEGLFSTLPSAVTVIFGYLTGSLIAEKGEDKSSLMYDLMWYGTTLGAAGLLWSMAFPINKPIWTSSYVLYAAGLAMIFLAVCVWTLDVKGWRSVAKPFLVFGANPLFAYVLSSVLVKTLNQFKYNDSNGVIRDGYFWIYKNIFNPIEGGKFGSLLFALAYMLLIWAICWVLYRRKIFVKI